MDDLVERLARKLAAHTSRRRLLGMLGTACWAGWRCRCCPCIASRARPKRRTRLASLAIK